MKREEALKLRAIVEQSSMSLDDKTASEGVTLFPRLKESGALITAGTRINWNGTLKRASVDLWDTAENNPNNAPSLWEDISYKNGFRIIPVTITTGTAFVKDECGYWGEVLYKSLIDANVWNPTQNASGWEEIS